MGWTPANGKYEYLVGVCIPKSAGEPGITAALSEARKKRCPVVVAQQLPSNEHIDRSHDMVLVKMVATTRLIFGNSGRYETWRGSQPASDWLRFTSSCPLPRRGASSVGRCAVLHPSLPLDRQSIAYHRLARVAVGRSWRQPRQHAPHLRSLPHAAPRRATMPAWRSALNHSTPLRSAPVPATALPRFSGDTAMSD
jgi:hypothetical protein